MLGRQAHRALRGACKKLDIAQWSMCAYMIYRSLCSRWCCRWKSIGPFTALCYAIAGFVPRQTSAETAPRSHRSGRLRLTQTRPTSTSQQLICRSSTAHITRDQARDNRTPQYPKCAFHVGLSRISTLKTTLLTSRCTMPGTAANGCRLRDQVAR